MWPLDAILGVKEPSWAIITVDRVSISLMVWFRLNYQGTEGTQLQVLGGNSDGSVHWTPICSWIEILAPVAALRSPSDYGSLEP